MDKDRIKQLIAHAETGSLRDMAAALRELAEAVENGGGGAVNWDDVQNKPSFGDLATEDSATSEQVTVTAYEDGNISAGDLQEVLQDLADRITALETALEGE